MSEAWVAIAFLVRSIKAFLMRSIKAFLSRSKRVFDAFQTRF